MDALKAVEQEHGVSIGRGGASYTDSNFTMRLDVSELADDGTAITKEATDYDALHKMYDLPERGLEFRSNGRDFKITGMKPRSSKYPVLAEDLATGGVYKFTVETIQNKVKLESLNK